MSTLFSLIIPHHNNVAGLARLLESVLAQCFKNIEVIIIDDASDESCEPVITAYRQKGLCITLLEQPQRVYTLRARLIGIQYANGKILGFADSDDMLWGTEALEKNIALFQEHDADIIHFRSVLIGPDGEFASYAPLADPFGRLLIGEEILAGYVQADFYGVCSLWNKFFSRELCQRVASEAYNPRFMLRREDAWLGLILLSAAKRYVGSDHVGYAYTWEEKRKTPLPERTVAQYRFLREAPQLLQSKGVPENTITRLIQNLEHTLCGDAGHMCRTLFQLPEPEREQQISAILQSQERDELLQALLMANSLNADRVVAIYNVFKNR